MPNILFSSNNIAHFPNSVAGSVVGTYDSNRVPYTIAASHFEELSSPVFDASTTDDTWFNFRTFFDGSTSNSAYTLLKAYDANENLLFNVRKQANVNFYAPEIILYDGQGVPIEVPCTISLTLSKTNSVAIRYTQTNLLIRLEVYVNGSLSGSAQFNANPNGYGNPIRFVLGTAYTASLTDIQHYSEIMVADDNTLNGRLDLLRPAAAGNYEDWQGQLGVLADDDTTTGMTTINAGDRQTMTMTAYSGASNISNFVSVSQTTRGLNSPSKLQHSIRLSGVDYDAVAHDIDFGLAYQITDYTINPATSLPWEGSDLAAIETGFISVT